MTNPHPQSSADSIMDPVTSGKCQYPNRYAVYMNRTGQTITRLIGGTIADSHPVAHIPLP